MAKYMLIYKGDATDMSELPEEAVAGVLAKWAAWMEMVGPALSDIGTPFGPGTSVVDDGTRGENVAITGYSIIEAASMEEAVALTDGHPYLSEGKGDFAVQVHELMPVPFES